MNIFGTALFVLMAGVSGIFIILSITSDVVVMETTGTIMEGTTWHEDERQTRECAEMGYYYDEYGEEYEECERYEYVTYYVCSTNLDFNYTLAEEPDGDVYEGQDTLTWDGSSGPCLQQIKDSYPVNGTLLVYYLSDDPTDASVGKPLEPSGMYFCCGICFGILAIPAGFFMFTNRSAAGRMKTGGMLGRFGPQRVSIAPTTNTQQGMPIPGTYGTNTNNVNAGQGRGGGFGGGGMMMAPGMVGGGAAYGLAQQSTPPQYANRGKKSSKSRNSHSPSRIDGYKQVIEKLNMSRGPSNVYDCENMLRSSGFMTAASANKFMAHPYVLKSLGLAAGAAAGAGVGAAVASTQSGMISRNVPDPADPNTNLRPAGSSDDRLQKMQEEAAAFFDSAKPKTPAPTVRPVSDGESDICAHPNCSVGVSAFDFRCFDCRQRFCSVHKGMTFQCDNCAAN
jgi:hypothetical protein